MKNKIILAILILSVIALVFTGCDGNPVVPTTNFCGLAVEEEIKDIFLKLNISEDPRLCPFYEDICTCFYHVYDDLKEAIDKEIDSQEIPGLTLRSFILNALYEEELVNSCYPDFVVGEASDYFSKLADNLSNWENNFASQTTKWAILGAIQALGMPTFGIGISSLFLGIDLLEINVAMAKLAEVVRNCAFFYYLFNRSQGDSHETAWGEGIPLLWSPEKKQATENFFKSLWDKYGEAILSDNLAGFKEEQHEMLRELILQALNQPSITPIIPASIIMEEFNGSSIGDSYGIVYTNTINGQGAVFSRVKESRIEYPFSIGFPHEGTIEYLIKVYNGYRYSDYVLNDNSDCARIFDTGSQDVWYPGAIWIDVCNDGTINLGTATTYAQPECHNLKATGTDFTFNEWHTIGISFGSQGQYIMLDGNIVAANASYTESLQTCGNFTSAVNVPTVGELVSCFWVNNRHDTGFEGVIDRFRVSEKQKDWYLSKTSSSQ